MKIRIPHFVVRAWDITGDWSNVAIYTRGNFEVRRIDIVLAVAGLACMGWYGYTSGWQGALLGGAMYVMVLMMALWIL